MKSINLLLLTFFALCVGTIEAFGDHSQYSRSVHLDCFDVFIPLMDRLSHEARNSTSICVSNANEEKERELMSIKNTRSEIHSEVKRIKDTLAHCSSRSDYMGYFECLHGIIETDKKIVSDITLKSATYSSKLNKIEEAELKCFRNSVLKLKEKITHGLNKLHYCLMTENGTESSNRFKHDFHQRSTESDFDITTIPASTHNPSTEGTNDEYYYSN